MSSIESAADSAVLCHHKVEFDAALGLGVFPSIDHVLDLGHPLRAQAAVLGVFRVIVSEEPVQDAL